MEKRDVKKWLVRQSEYISQKPWFTVRREFVELPNGSVIPDYHVFEYPDWICVVAIDREGKMIIERQYRHGLGDVFCELCAGVVDATDATCLDAAKRELLEETGYGNGEWRELAVVCANPGTHNNLTHCFLATGVERVSEACCEATEDISVEFMTPQQVKDLLEKNKIMQAIHVAALWKFFAENPIPSGLGNELL